MTEQQLGEKLRDAYENAPRGEQVTMIHLFGIEFHKQIDEVGVLEVIQASGLHVSYRTELNKGMRLAKYVKRR